MKILGYDFEFIGGHRGLNEARFFYRIFGTIIIKRKIILQKITI